MKADVQRSHSCGSSGCRIISPRPRRKYCLPESSARLYTGNTAVNVKTFESKEKSIPRIPKCSLPLIRYDSCLSRTRYEQSGAPVSLRVCLLVYQRSTAMPTVRHIPRYRRLEAAFDFRTRSSPTCRKKRCKCVVNLAAPSNNYVRVREESEKEDLCPDQDILRPSCSVTVDFRSVEMEMTLRTRYRNSA